RADPHEWDFGFVEGSGNQRRHPNQFATCAAAATWWAIPGNMQRQVPAQMSAFNPTAALATTMPSQFRSPPPAEFRCARKWAVSSDAVSAIAMRRALLR